MKTENKRRLSEVMRTGAAKRPQCRHSLFRFCGGVPTASCSLGAAYEGAFDLVARSMETVSSALKPAFPILLRHFDHPVTHVSTRLDYIIVNLNDVCGWTREQIADFVEKCECEEAAKEAAIDRFIEHREPEPVLT